MKYDIRLYYRINGITLERYLRLRHTKMYIHGDQITESHEFTYRAAEEEIRNIRPGIYNITPPGVFYFIFTHVEDIKIPFQEIFAVSNEVIDNSRILFPKPIVRYISIHLRLGDKYLETDKTFVDCGEDVRKYDEAALFAFIERTTGTSIVFFCDNRAYKQKLKIRYPQLIITECDIGHTGLLNITDKQTLDTVTEFYYLSRSDRIYTPTISGFAIVAAAFGGQNVTMVIASD
jgi:hypothetical protein